MQAVATGDRLRARVRGLLSLGRVGRSIALLTGGAALGQATVVLAAPLLTRLYSPQQFGILAVFTSIIYVLMTVAALRYDIALLLPDTDEQAAPVLGTALVAVVLVSTVTAGIVFVLREPLPDWLNAPSLGPFLWLIPVTLLGAGFFTSLSGWAVRHKDFRTLARTKFIQSFGMVVVQGIAGLMHLGTLGLLFGGAVSNAGGGDLLARSAWRTSGAALRRVRATTIAAAAWQYRRFPLLGAPAALVNSFGLAFPLLALSAIYQPQVAGWYVLAQRVVARPLELVSLAVAQIYNSEVSRLVSDDPKAALRLALKVTLGMTALVAPYVVIVAFAAPPLFELVFGADWEGAGHFVRLMSLMFIFQISVSPIADTLEMLQRQDLYVAREVVRMGLLGGAALLAASLHLSPEQAVLLFSAAIALMYSGLAVITVYAFRVRIRQRLSSSNGHGE